jgi:hypothetical protein
MRVLSRNVRERDVNERVGQVEIQQVIVLKMLRLKCRERNLSNSMRVLSLCGPERDDAYKRQMAQERRSRDFGCQDQELGY